MEIWGIGVVTVATLLLFIGATGKSAQIPLYVWLPDAMQGPTPVSALIHAATMVTAGVYMIGRLNVLFSAAPVTLGIVAVVGAATALLAATIAVTQTDIKRVLAYSTISQLGYMFLAMGVAAYAAGIFHLLTHAFFKACLFLGSGSIIHAMQGEQDMRQMGGLRTAMPATFWTFAIAVLAIAGTPFLAGFFSKDAITVAGLGHPQPVAVGRGGVRGGPHGLLHVSPVLHGVLRRLPRRPPREGAPARVAEDHDLPAVDSRRGFRRHRVYRAAGVHGRAARSTTGSIP